MYKITNNKKLNQYKTVSNSVITQLQETHKNSPDELFWGYCSLIFENIPLPKVGKNEILAQTFWKKLSKPQQVIWTLRIFIEQTNNGGIWQFFFNKTEYISAVGVSFEQFGNMNLFGTFYNRCFNELAAILDNGEFFKICDIWNDESLPFEQRWAAFKAGENYITKRADFEDYFYSDKGKNRLYELINKYITQNLGAMLVVENEDKNESKAAQFIDKKAAIPHFSNYLVGYYGVAPAEISIYYTATVTIENKATKLFLMYFKMPNGYESLGVTGYFTHNFEDVDWADIKKMYQKHHKQELINIYYGWYLIAKDRVKNKYKPEFDEHKWESFLKKLQDPKKTQIPVNVKFKNCFFYNNVAHYTYTGDLLYHEKTTIFPTDLSNVRVLGVRDKENSGYSGELNLLFSSVDNQETANFGRQSPDISIDTKRLWERFVGRKNKIIKDNPWGF
jgi:hypothetical protein